ncbi:unnamed protein product [Arabidopsis halleri]
MSNKERIEDLETNLSELREELVNIDKGVNSKFQAIEEAINKLTDAVTLGRDVRDGSAIRTTLRSGGQENQLQPQGENTNLTNAGRSVKLDFSRFKGGDPTAWISKAKKYFDYNSTPIEQKALREAGIQITWAVFEEELWVRFGPTDGDDFDEALSKIQQTGTLNDYQREFERLQKKVEGWTQKALIGTYVGGLNPTIADSVRMFRPKTLKEVLNLARLKDEQMQRQKKKFSNHSLYKAASTALTNRFSSFKESEPKPTETRAPRRLSWDELKKKISLGLCFSCDEKFIPGHKCKQPQLFIMEGENDEEEEETSRENDEDDNPEISVYALTGWNAPQIIRLLTRIGKHELTALVDSGSTHNFVSERTTRELKLRVTPVKSFSVKVADGKPLQCRGKLEGVTVKIGGANFKMTLYALPLVGLDMVLGVQWLSSLGPTVCD